MKRLEDYTWEELLEATSTKESLKENGKLIGQYTFENGLGIHTDDEELRREWARMGGEANIENLLEWQKENNHNIGEIAKHKSDEWKENISKALMGKEVSNETKEKLSKIVNEYNSSLTDEERKEKYSNDSSSRKSLRVRKEILDSIETETFTTSQIRYACEKYGLGNWKGLLKDERLVEQLYKGTNQSNPSVYRKVYK
jgi:hypothetical protein